MWGSGWTYKSLCGCICYDYTMSSSGTMPDVMKFSNFEDVSDQDTDSNDVEREECFVCCIWKWK